MKLDYEKKLEAAINRELKGLPELPAPATLAPRVMAALQRRASVPWYRQGWLAWPGPVRFASLLLLLALFAGLYYFGWRAPQVQGMATAGQEAGRWCAGLMALWKGLNVVASVFVLALKQLKPVFLISAFSALALAYAVGIALAGCYVRLGLARSVIYDKIKD